MSASRVKSFSLIVATVGRVTELERLLSSLKAQSFTDFEILIVDQNDDDRLRQTLNSYRALDIHHLRSALGLSLARNEGLRLAVGEIIAFPDDDCWYPSTLLASINAWFNDHPTFDGVFTSVRDAHGTPIVPRWPPAAGVCTKSNVWDCTVSFTGFLRSRLVRAVGDFDENLGLGAASAYQASEDIDYFIRPLDLGFQMWYEPQLVVHHPRTKAHEILFRRAYPFGLAYGYVLGKHRYSWLFFCGRLIRSVGGMVLAGCRLDATRAHLYGLRAAGQLRGFCSGLRHHQNEPKASNNLESIDH